jgi:hypothetical protein
MFMMPKQQLGGKAVQTPDSALMVPVTSAGGNINLLNGAWSPGDDWRTFTPVQTTSPYPAVPAPNSGAGVLHYPIPAAIVALDVTPRYIPGTDQVDPVREAEYAASTKSANELTSNVNRYALDLAKNLPTAADSYEEIMSQSYAWAINDGYAVQGGDDTTSILGGRMVTQALMYILCKPAAVARNDTRRHAIEAWLHRRTAQPMVTFLNVKRRQNLMGLAAYYVYAVYIATGDPAMKSWAINSWKLVVDGIREDGYHALELLRSINAEHYHIYTMLGLCGMAVLAEANGDASLWNYVGAGAGASTEPALLRLGKAINRNLDNNFTTKEMVSVATGRYGEGAGTFIQNPYPRPMAVPYGSGSFVTTAAYETLWFDSFLAHYTSGHEVGGVIGKLRAARDANRTNGAVLAGQIGYLEPGPLVAAAMGVASFTPAVFPAGVKSSGTPLKVTKVNGLVGSVGQPIVGDNGGSFVVQQNGDMAFQQLGISSLAPTEDKFRRTSINVEAGGRVMRVSAYVVTEPRSLPYYVTNGDFVDGYRGWLLCSAQNGPSEGNASAAGVVITTDAYGSPVLRWKQRVWDDTSARNRETMFLKGGVTYTATMHIKRYVSGRVSFYWSAHPQLLVQTDNTDSVNYNAVGTYTKTFTPNADCYFGLRLRGGVAADMDVDFISLGIDPAAA